MAREEGRVHVHSVRALHPILCQQPYPRNCKEAPNWDHCAPRCLFPKTRKYLKRVKASSMPSAAPPVEHQRASDQVGLPPQSDLQKANGA